MIALLVKFELKDGVCALASQQGYPMIVVPGRRTVIRTSDEKKEMGISYDYTHGSQSTLMAPHVELPQS